MAENWVKRLFMAGGVILIVFGLVHGLPLIHDPLPANNTERQLVALATNHKFKLRGSVRTLAEL